jgi:hypothetical protein
MLTPQYLDTKLHLQEILCKSVYEDRVRRRPQER